MSRATFYNPGSTGDFELNLQFADGKQFKLLKPIAYRDDNHPEPFEVPGGFRTDLASVPDLFTWLVPRNGVYTPAAVLHDALVNPELHFNPPVDRFEADHIFRRALRELGTGRVRARLMWTAVTANSMVKSSALWDCFKVILTVEAVVIIGIVATGDLFDKWGHVPWMGDRPWWQELIGGALGALAFPVLTALLWWRRWAAGYIAGVALAFLLHVTLVLWVLYRAYLGIERLASGPRNKDGTYGKHPLKRHDVDAVYAPTSAPVPPS
jgi:hypothetical protein